MAQSYKLTRREREVVELLLQGKSNKVIAASLSISDRTVEFHLKNIYTKFQVSSRIELILKLGNTTGKLKSEKPGSSTVASSGKNTENSDTLNSGTGWAMSFKDSLSIIGKELKMKNFWYSKHLLVGTATALAIGFLWLFALSSQLLPSQIKTFIVPLIICWLIIGFLVGLIGKHNGNTLLKVGFSALLGAGLSPLTIIPLMLVVVLPVGKFAERLGLIDPSTIPGDIALTLSASIMVILWLIVGITIGVVAISDLKKSEPPMIQPHVSENRS